MQDSDTQLLFLLNQIANGKLEFVPEREEDAASVAEFQTTVQTLLSADRNGLIRVIEVRHQKQVAESPYVRVRVGELTEAGRALIGAE